MTTLAFRSDAGRCCFFSAEAEIWAVAQGELHAAGQVLRGWFYAPLPVPIGTRGEVCIISGVVECRTVVPVFVSFQAGEMGLWRHEFTSVKSEVQTTSWLPPAEPVTMEMLRRLFAAPTDGARVILDGEGGWRIASLN